MKAIDSAGFEAMFRIDVDPWNYATSPFEAFKRRGLLQACGDRCRGRVLELACANGQTSLALEPRALRLLAIDGSPTAVNEVRRRTRGLGRVAVRTAVLPGDMPNGPFDLIVVSELLYYLAPNALRVLLPRIASAAAPGGRVVLLHHHVSFADAAQLPSLVHGQARVAFGRHFRETFRRRGSRYEAVAFDRQSC